MNHLLTLNNVLSKYLIFIILGFSCIAYIVPEYFYLGNRLYTILTWYSHVWHGAYY